MSSQAGLILNDIIETLRQADLGAPVSGDANGSDTTVPRMGVTIKKQEFFPADDSASLLWGRLIVIVSAQSRCEDTSLGVDRLFGLCDAARDALDDDPFRSGLCKHLPIGQATESGGMELVSNIRKPEMQMNFTLRCHFEMEAE